MRGEHAFYHALCKAVPELHRTTRALDTSLLTTQLGKRKSMSDPRPDYYHYIRSGSMAFAIHIEYDENKEHEDCDERLATLANSTDATVERTYVIRVAGHHGDKDHAVCKKYTINKHYTYYKVTQAGKQVVQLVAAAVRERFDWIYRGLAHCDKEGRLRKMYIQ